METTHGNDPLFLEKLSEQAKARGCEIEAARLSDIAYKLRHLESIAIKGLTGHLRDLEAAGRDTKING